MQQEGIKQRQLLHQLIRCMIVFMIMFPPQVKMLTNRWDLSTNFKTLFQYFGTISWKRGDVLEKGRKTSSSSAQTWTYEYSFHRLHVKINDLQCDKTFKALGGVSRSWRVVEELAFLLASNGFNWSCAQVHLKLFCEKNTCSAWINKLNKKKMQKSTLSLTLQQPGLSGGCETRNLKSPGLLRVRRFVLIWLSAN